MQRAHNLLSSGNLVFIDTTSACDAGSHSVTFILSPCQAGAVPLAVLITSGQSEEAYSTAFKLLKTQLPGAFGNRGFPQTAFTDNSAAEINAIKNTWPSTKHLLCIFHVLQAIWRWLWDSGNNILSDDRTPLMNSFKKIMYAENVLEMETAYQSCIKTGIKYEKWIKYIGDYWKCKEKWVLSYRNQAVRGNHTNNFAEATIRIFKDVALSRLKAYNVISLIDTTSTTLEDYYRRKLLNFANFHNRSSLLFFRKNMKKTTYLKEEDIVRINEYLFLVPSEKNQNESYTVDSQVGSCSCPIGKYGNFCKHQAAVYQHFDVFLVNLPPITKKDRHEMAAVALGESAPKISFYDEFETVQPLEPENTDDVFRAVPATDTDTCILETENSRNNETLDQSLQVEELIHCTFEILGEKLRTYSAAQILPALRKYKKTLQNISSEGMLMKFLHSVPMTMRRYTI